MNLPYLAVRRPVLTSVILLVVLFFGVFSVYGLELDLLPELDLPIAVVTATYSGAGPKEVEQLIARPLEEALSRVGGVKHIHSISNEGAALVLLEFEWGTNLDNAVQEMRESVDRARGLLPDGAGDPMVLRLDPGQIPVITLALTDQSASGDDISRLQRAAEDILIPRLERLEGVASVSLNGGRDDRVEVRFDPGTLRSYGISFSQVAGVLSAHNISLPGGSVDEAGRSYSIRVNSQFSSIEEIRRVLIPTSSGGMVRLGDVAEVVLTGEDAVTYTRLNGTPAVGLSIQKESGSNTVVVSNRVNAELEALRDQLPPGLTATVVLDQADFIMESIQQVVNNTMVGAVLAIIVLLVFLKDWRSTLVISIAIPFSVIASFTLIYFGGLTLNMLSLGGLALGVGMMVDNSIVVLENIFRLRQEGVATAEAAIEGTREVSGAITASTLTTLAVFLPVVFLQGIAAEIFRDLSLTVSFSLTASLLVAVIGVPLFSSRILGRISGRALAAFAGNESHNPDQRSRRGLQRYYRRFLAWSLDHRRVVLIGLLVIFTGSAALIPLLSAEFLPATDEGQIIVSVELPVGSSLSETNRIMSQLENIAREIPEVESVLTLVGTSTGAEFSGGVGSQSTGEMQLVLVDLDQRRRSAAEVADELRAEFAKVPGAEITVTDNLMGGGGGGAGASLGGGIGGTPVVVEIRGFDLEVLKSLANDVARVVASVDGTTDVQTSFDEGSPELNIVVNRERAAAFGLMPIDVAQRVRAAVTGQTVTRYRGDGSEVDVVVRVHPDFAQDRQALTNLPIDTPAGITVPLSELAVIEEGRGPVSIVRSDRALAVNVTAGISGRELSDVMADLQAGLRSLPIPAGYSIDLAGQFELMVEAFSGLAGAAVLGAVIMYLVMAAQFESWLFPFCVMFTVPMSLSGAIIGLAVTGRPFSAPAFVGVIMLMGIIVNNAIVLVDYANQLRQRGMERRQALLEAGAVRLRPVLMTALTTILAMIPMALGIGEGAEIQAPLATVVMSGLLFGTFLTLVALPVIYSWIDDWFGRGRSRRAVKAPDANHERSRVLGEGAQVVRG